MLDSLRDKVDKLIKKCDNDLDMQKYELIKQIISDDNCFYKMDAETAISILVDLHFNIEEAKKIYIALINEENI